MTRVLLATFLFCSTCFAWPPAQFAVGTFSIGVICPGFSIGLPTPSGPGDGYESGLFAYYTLDDTTAPVVDSAHARNLSENNGDTSTASASGKIGNALQVNSNDEVLPWVTLLYNDSDGNDFNFAGNFTIRCWIKTSISDAFFGNIIGDYSWELYLGNGSDHGHVFFYLKTSGDSDINLDGGSINDGNWHRIMAWFDGSVGAIQIDNNTPTTISASDHINGGTGAEMDIGGHIAISETAVYLDEVGMWDVALTSDDRLFDWNEGAGRSWPLP